MHGPRARVEIGSFLLSFIALAPAAARAQQSARLFFPPLELRVDAIDVRSAESGTLHAGLGTNLPLGSYMRLEIVGAGGISRRDSVNHEGGRFDVLARFLLDPFAETRWGLSIGGGLSAIFADAARTHEYLVVILDVEAPRVGKVVPAMQVGLGGGVRVGIVARASRPRQR